MLPFETQDISTQTRSSVSAHLGDDQAGDVLEHRSEDDLLEFRPTATAWIQPSEGAMAILSDWAAACGEAS